jgi:hypothetical protein
MTSDDPLRGQRGRFRAATLGERLLGLATAEPEPAPPEPPKPSSRLIPSGPMSDSLPTGDFVRTQLARIRR